MSAPFIAEQQEGRPEGRPFRLRMHDLQAATLSHWQTITLPIHIVHPSRRLVPRRLNALMDAIADGLRSSPPPLPG